MELLKEYIIEKKDIRSNDQIAKHADWTDAFLSEYDNVTEENIEQILEQEVEKYFAKYSKTQVYINAQMKELKPLNVSFPHSDGYTSDKLLLWQYIPFGKGVKKRTFRSF